MAIIINNMNDLKKQLNIACEKAIKNVAERMVNELQSYINEDFYRQYRPQIYTRTYQLLKSPKYDMLNQNAAKIFIDMDTIHYLIGDPKYKTDENEIVKMASLGYHGNYDIYRPGTFWADFIGWCNNNLMDILKSELRKQGISVK